MKTFRSTGHCALCNQAVAKAQMTRHLKSCLAKRNQAAAPTEGAGGLKTFHLLVEGRYAKEYWLHLEVPAAASLENLDQFLRDTWLECCGHLSAFTIGRTSYSSSPRRDNFWEGSSEQSMAAKLYKVIGPGTIFRHEYDFGTTTELELKVIAECLRPDKTTDIEVLARNDPPPIPCAKCQAPATHVCPSCVFGADAWFCDQCAKEHECGEEMLLPVVNSPRVGMCGYCG